MDFTNVILPTDNEWGSPKSPKEIEVGADKIVDSAYEAESKLFNKIGINDPIEARKIYRKICKASCDANGVCNNLKKNYDLIRQISDLYKSTDLVPNTETLSNLLVVIQCQGNQFKKILEARGLLEYVVGINAVPPTSDEISKLLVEGISAALDSITSIVRMLILVPDDPDFNRLRNYASLNLINELTFRENNGSSTNTTPLIWLAINAALAIMADYNIFFNASDFEDIQTFLKSLENVFEFCREYKIIPDKEYGFAQTLLSKGIDSMNNES